MVSGLRQGRSQGVGQWRGRAADQRREGPGRVGEFPPGDRPVGADDELLLLTSANKIIRLSVSGISSVGRATQGVMLVRMDENDTVMGFDLVDPSDLDRCAPSDE